MSVMSSSKVGQAAFRIRRVSNCYDSGGPVGKASFFAHNDVPGGKRPLFIAWHADVRRDQINPRRKRNRKYRSPDFNAFTRERHKYGLAVSHGSLHVTTYK